MQIPSNNLIAVNPNNRRKNSDDRQKRNLNATHEGVIVNNFIKDCCEKEGFIIPEHSFLQQELKNKPKKVSNNPFLPICVITLGVLGGAAVITSLAKHCAKIKLKLPEWDRLPDIPRNMNLNSESHFVTYVAMQNPTFKTAMGAFAVFGFSSVVFAIKNGVDGIKEIWVKKQEASIQRDLQEKLIAVETRSFSGKNQIIRNMISQRANEISILLGEKVLSSKLDKNFFRGIGFKGKNDANETNKSVLLLVGASTFAAATILGIVINKNIKKTLSLAKDYSDGLHDKVAKIIEKETLGKKDKEALKQCLETLNFKPEYVKEQMTKAKIFTNDEIDETVDFVKEKSRKYVQAPEALGGKRGIQYYSYIDGVEGHLYNWLMTECKLARNLFYALATVTGLGYLGQKSVEAIKEVQVKKFNAKTEYELQNQLVEVELKNFLSKKTSAIEPLMDIFRRKISETSDKNELKPMANEILSEIKNGAPFVYS